MKLIVTGIAVLAAFWAGYGLCAYRYTSVLLPEAMRSRNVWDASIHVRSIELIDKGDIPALRAKLFVVADTELNTPMPASIFGWRNLINGPLETIDEPWDSVRQQSDERAAKVRAEIKRLCQSPPQTESYRRVCGR